MLQPLSHAATMLRACFIAADTGRDRNFLRGQLSENTFQKFPLVGAELSPSCLKGGFEIGVEEFSREALKWMDNAGGGARSFWYPRMGILNKFFSLLLLGLLHPRL